MRHFLRPFIWIVTAVLALIWAYLCSRLELSPAWRAILGVPFVAVWVLPAVFWPSDREEMGAAARLLHRCAFLSMGYLSFLGVIVLARDVIFLPARVLGLSIAGEAFAPGADVWIAGLAGLALAVGVFRALAPPRVHEVEVSFEGLPLGMDGFRIVQISDLHIGLMIRRRFVEKVVERANALRPDLVAITGDIADGDPAELREQTAPLAGLKPCDRVFYVIGNHECYWDARKWMDELKSLGAKVLLNSGETIEHRGEKILVAGVSNPALGEKPDPGAAAAQGEPFSFRVLLAHQPNVAPLASDAGFDLQLSGHTHGGQFFPWTLIARRVHRQLISGLSRWGKLWVYVSPGTGTWGPPVRIGTSHEITLIRLKLAH